MGSGAATNGTISYASNGGASSEGQFNITTGGISYSGLIDSTVDDGSNLSSSTIVTLTSSGRTESIDIVLSKAFETDSATAAQSLLMSGSSVSSFTFKVGTGNSSTAEIIIAVHADQALGLLRDAQQ